MSIITGRGDDGTTALLFGRRVPKTHPRVRACGALDELNAALGLAKASAADKKIRTGLEKIQRDLIKAGTQLAAADEDSERFRRAKHKKITMSQVRRIEGWAARLEKGQRPAPENFILPGSGPLEASLHLARAVCRRAEREAVAARNGAGAADGRVLQYLNRLSDLLWLLAREQRPD